MDVEGVLVDVGHISSSCYASGGCQISTISPHSLHYKHSCLGPWCRLLDFVATLKKMKTFFFLNLLSFSRDPGISVRSTSSALHPWQRWQLYLLPGWSQFQGRCCWWWLRWHTWGCTALRSEFGLQTTAEHLHTPSKVKQGKNIDLFNLNATNSLQAPWGVLCYSLPQTLLLQAELRCWTCGWSPRYFPCVCLEAFLHRIWKKKRKKKENCFVKF